MRLFQVPQGFPPTLRLGSFYSTSSGSPPPSKRYDVAIVGGGIVGVATAREIKRRFPTKKIVILEKESTLATHQSGHNSGVIHAGIYYKPGSAIARCCVKGADMIYDFCKKKNIPHERVGKLIVATSEDEVPVLHQLLERGNTNGVKDLEILDGKAVKKLEPNVEVVAALHSPNTGIVDYAVVTAALAEEVVSDSNGFIITNFEVNKMEKVGDEVHLIKKNDEKKEDVVVATHVVTCAGLYSDRVSMIAGGNREPRIIPFRGSYYEMKPEYKNIVKRNIYPVPSNAGIPVGIHFTPTVRGQMIIGPGACLAFDREGYKFFDFELRDFLDSLSNPNLWKLVFSNFRMSINEVYKDLNRTAFLREAQKMVPSLNFDQTQRSFAGVMAQVITDEGKNASDFIFESNVMGGSILNVRNAPSPACTSSLQLGVEIVDKAATDFHWH